MVNIPILISDVGRIKVRGRRFVLISGSSTRIRFMG